MLQSCCYVTRTCMIDDAGVPPIIRPFGDHQILSCTAYRRVLFCPDLSRTPGNHVPARLKIRGSAAARRRLRNMSVARNPETVARGVANQVRKWREIRIILAWDMVECDDFHATKLDGVLLIVGRG